MPRYVTRGFIDCGDPLRDYHGGYGSGIQVEDSCSRAVPSGLLDADGQELYRMKPAMGFLRD
jgi:hypothetical protein